MQNLKAAFEVVPYPDTYVARTVRRWDAKLKKFVAKVTKEPVGYMVFLPRGDSIRVRNDEELKRLRLDREPEIVDMDSGDVVGKLQRKTMHRSGAHLFEAVEAPNG